MPRFPRTYASAVRVQRELRNRLVLKGDVKHVRRIAGADVSYERFSDRFFASVAVLAWPSLELVDEAHAEGKSPMPYIPGLLSFREGPTILRAFRGLRESPDLILFDGHGTAHPRGFGVACHLGLLLDTPSIGCGKSRLVGEFDEPGPRRGDRSLLRVEGRQAGAVVRTRDGVKPMFVSPGHRIGIPGAVRWVLRCGAGYRQPEPTRRAHELANRERVRRAAAGPRS